ncbi:MAG: hypothetical protein IPI95_16240 [Flavobacteriales bacterium]|nr:hypothetical protein [Flavobacteriales bacterium]
MTDETPKYEVLDEAEFDFSFENFREIGYEFTGTVTTSEVRAIPEQTFEPQGRQRFFHPPGSQPTRHLGQACQR